MGIDRERAPLTWWSPLYGLIWSDDDERTYQLLEAGQAVERLTLPLDAEQLCAGVRVAAGNAESDVLRRKPQTGYTSDMTQTLPGTAVLIHADEANVPVVQVTVPAPTADDLAASEALRRRVRLSGLYDHLDWDEAF